MVVQQIGTLLLAPYTMLIVCRIYVADDKVGILDEPELYSKDLDVPFTVSAFAYTLLVEVSMSRVIVKVLYVEAVGLTLVKAQVKLEPVVPDMR